MSTVLLARNTFTTPSFETASGTVEIRRNYAARTDKWSVNIGGTSGASIDTGTLRPGSTAGYSIKGTNGTGAAAAMNIQLWDGTTAPLIPVTPGQVVTYNAWLYRPDGGNANAQIRWRNSSNTEVGQSNGTVTSAASWVKASVTGTAPAGAAYAHISFNSSGAAIAAGASWYISEPVAELLSVVLPFFGGATAPFEDFTCGWLAGAGTSPAIMTAPGLAGVSALGAGAQRAVFQSTQWAYEGTKSLRIKALSTDPNGSMNGAIITASPASMGYANGDTITIVAAFRMTSPQTGTLATEARSIRYCNSTGVTYTGQFAQASNVAGVQIVRLTTTVVDAVNDRIRLSHGADATNSDVWWDLLTPVKGTYSGPPFSGSTPYDGAYYIWDGPVDASTSSRWSITLPDLPPGTTPPVARTIADVLYGNRTSSYRWEVLTHSAGEDHLLGYLDGVVEGSLSWATNRAVRGNGTVKVADVETAAPGLLRIRDLDRLNIRLRPVLQVDGLPDMPWGVFLISTSPEDWTAAGKTLSLNLLDRSTVLDQDSIDASYTVTTATPVLAAIKSVIESAGESIQVDPTVTLTLATPKTWDPGTSKLEIVNSLLKAINYNLLWIDGTGRFQATPYVVPAKRSLAYDLLPGMARELVDGPTSIYSTEWSRTKDFWKIPNKVIAVQSGTGNAPALSGVWTNEDPNSPFSWQNRGGYIDPISGQKVGYKTNVILNVQVPDFSTAPDPTAATVAFLASVAQQSGIAASAVQGTIQLKHVPIPVQVLDVIRYTNGRAALDGRYTISSLTLDATPTGLMSSNLLEVIDL